MLPSATELMTLNVSSDGNQIGARVKQRRRYLRMTQDALCARLADVTGGGWIADRRDIYRIENGASSWYTGATAQWNTQLSHGLNVTAGRMLRAER